MYRSMISGLVLLALGAALALMPPTPAAAQRAASEAEETALWDSVKQSKSADEVRTYLDRFPNGLYAPLARIRLRNLEGSGSSPKPQGGSASQTPPPPPQTSLPPAPLPSSTAPALTNPTVIREVQDLLYNLNYQIGPRNGRLTSQTRDAIRKWQENVKQPVSGDMNEAQLALLRRARLPTVWGALAYHTKGATATTWNRPTRENAENEALAECRKRARTTCSVLTVASKICGALGFYNAVVGGRQHWGVYASVRPTLGQATDNALSECRRQARQPNACGVRITVCADGGHSR
jgi:peptidoglycan hydrolase-like protein with peptidoglycan-binding domain